MIEIQVYRMRIGLNNCRLAKVKGFDYLNYFEIYIIMATLLIGFIERNPGPLLDDSSASSSVGSTLEDKSIKHKFSVVHYTIQSISNKVDLIESELRNFDVICLTETCVYISDDLIKRNGFKLYRRDRACDNHGGICVCVNQALFSCRRQDLELQLECIGLRYQSITEKKYKARFIDHRELII